MCLLPMGRVWSWRVLVFGGGIVYPPRLVWVRGMCGLRARVALCLSGCALFDITGWVINYAAGLRGGVGARVSPGLFTFYAFYSFDAMRQA